MERLLSAGLGNAALVSALAVLVLLIDRLSRRPALAHWLWLLLLIKLITPPIVTLPQAWLAPRQNSVGSSEPLVVPVERPEPGSATAEAVEQPGAHPVEKPSPPAGVPSAARLLRTAMAIAPHWTSVAGAIWVAGSAVWILRVFLRLRRARRLLDYALRAPEPLQARARELARRIGLRRCPGIWIVPGTVSPLLWALGAPRLFIPGDLWEKLDSAQHDALLVHELAHLKRRDHWVRFVELGVMSLFWWYPVAWWARRSLRDAEEQCCDAWVVWALPGRSLAYATALLDTIDFLAQSSSSLPLSASGAWHLPSLKARLAMIMRGGTPRILSRTGAVGVAGIAAMLLPLSPPRFPARYYALMDLGTLGGTVSEARHLNNAGQVVGIADGRDGWSHGFLTWPNQPIDPARDALESAGTRTRYASGINREGQTIVVRETRSVPYETWASFVVDSGAERELGSLELSSFLIRPDESENRDYLLRSTGRPRHRVKSVQAIAINDSRQVVGTVEDNWLQARAFRTRPGASIDPAADDLGDLGYPSRYGKLETRASDINASGQVVGWTTGPRGVPRAFRTGPNLPIDAATDDLGTLGGDLSEARAINDLGMVVGWSHTVGLTQEHAFRTRPNRPINAATDDLGTLGGRSSAAYGINNSGLVVGISEDGTYRDGRARLVKWHRNDDGAVGEFRVTLAQRPFFHDGTRMHDLNSLISPESGWFLSQAYDINDRGQIVGNGINPSGEYHGFLMTPVPELDRILVLVAGTTLAGLGFGLIRIRGAG